MNHTISALTLTLLLATPIKANNPGSQFLDSGVPSVETTDYQPDPGNTRSDATVSVPSGNLNFFTVDFGSLPEDSQFCITWNAPEGKCFEAKAPADYDSAILVFEWVVGSDPGFLNITDPLETAEFQNQVGSVTPADALLFYNSSGAKVIFTFRVTPGETVSFSELKITGCFPAAMNTNLSNTSVSLFQIEGRAFQDMGAGNLSDAGQWFSAASKEIAEPPGTSDSARDRSLSRKIKKLKKRLKKLKRSGNNNAARRIAKKIRKLRKRL